MKSMIGALLPQNLKKLLVERNKKKEEDYWKKQHLVKQLAIKSYQDIYKINILVETGTYMGDMVWAQLNTFKKIYSIELGKDLWAAAVARFKTYPHVTILNGDSGKVLNKVIPQLATNAIFWLDGHYSAGITAKGDVECPIYEELTAIFKSNFKHILLIDDARCFNGKNDYPTIENLSDFILKNRPESLIKIEDDILRVELK